MPLRIFKGIPSSPGLAIIDRDHQRGMIDYSFLT